MTPPHVMIGLTAATMTQDTAGYGLVQDAAIVVADGLIEWVGPASELPSEYAGLDRQIHDGRLIASALIDGGMIAPGMRADPASGVWRHAVSGYEDAIACTRENGLRLPRLMGN